MTLDTIVLDADVTAKLFVDEPDSEQVLDLVEYIVQKQISIISPELAKYEVANIVKKNDGKLEPVIALLEDKEEFIIQYVRPQKSTWLKAEEITDSISPRNHAPYIYDSIYHAMAIEEQGVFITADKKHYDKAKGFEHILLLRHWEQIKA